MVDFSAWDRTTLERFAADAFAELQRLAEENRMLLEAWRREVTRANLGGITTPDPP